MSSCPKCLVLLEDDAVECPLCGSPAIPGPSEGADPALPGSSAAEAQSAASGFPLRTTSGPQTGAPVPGPSVGRGPADAAPSRGALGERPRRRSGRFALELLSVVLGIVAAVTVLADLFGSGSISWSRYSVLSLALLWLVCGLPMVLGRWPWLLFAALVPSAVLGLFLFDVLDGSLDWFLDLGLPVAVLAAGCTAAVVGLSKALSRRGLNLVGIVFAAAALFCLGLEFVLDFRSGDPLRLGWSVVVALSLLPAGGFLFYAHYRLLRGATLSTLFRL